MSALNGMKIVLIRKWIPDEGWLLHLQLRDHLLKCIFQRRGKDHCFERER